ncbi:CRISPR-associated protein Csx16 [Thalassotalea ponticola]|uniref:CRISPR-associated protein Csx16 n=1 Tax=Thalassotalea ponticola TaxID=1523392 RepID=UPI0025B2F206|nr:CRISPR-associated protein Csx16 [Thalassotalea ponticola]MDN3651348.1 CRISPR-associated protein Csx16 [Thalassotalea ponticola]
MKKYFISRHQAAINWSLLMGLGIDEFLSHCTDTSAFKAGDCVYGNLPLHLVEQLCINGVRYYNLNIDIPATLRGKELTNDEFLLSQPILVEYHLQRIRK